MHILFDILGAMLAAVLMMLVFANLFVMIMTMLHKRRTAMRILMPFSRAISLLRMGDNHPSRPYRRR